MKLISLNIEGRRHLDLVIPFLRRERPDIVCLQELIHKDVQLFEKELGVQAVYQPLMQWDMDRHGHLEPWGIALLSALPLSDVRTEYYWQVPGELPEHKGGEGQDDVNRAVLSAGLAHPDGPFRAAVTHFPKAPKGTEVTDFQRTALRGLLEILGRMPEFVLSGDFNAPRGLEIFDAIAARYKDNVPAEYASSIGSFHRAGPLPYMIDGLFTTPQYKAENVHLVDGLSDHQAVVAEIRRG